MKNLSLLLIFALFMLSSCRCHFYGLKSGMNVSTITGDNTDNYDPKLGFVFGGVAELCLDEHTAIQPEILYSQQGAKYSDVDAYDGTIKLDYINVPVMARFKVTDKFVLEAGPQAGVLLSAKDDYKSVDDSGEHDISDDMSTFDYGANFGVNYDFLNGWIIGARYNLGLSNVNKDSGLSNKNGVLQVTAAFRF